MYRYLEAKKDKIVEHINQVPKNEILGSDEKKYCNYLLVKFRIGPLSIDRSKIHADEPEDITLRSNNPRYDSFFKGLSVKPIKGTRITIYIPFGGDSELIKVQPSSHIIWSKVANVHSNEIVLSYEYDPHTNLATTKQLIEKEMRYIEDNINNQKNQIYFFNNSLIEFITSALNKRKAKIQKDDMFLTSLKIPIKRKENSIKFKPEKVKIKLAVKKPKINNPKPEFELEYTHYQYIVKIINDMGEFLEKASKAIRQLKEEDLRDLFLAMLNSHYENQASGETFNKSGKTDIIIKKDGKNLFIAECKIWRGDKLFMDGIDQLLNYLTWRDTKTSLIIFNKNGNFTKIVTKAKQLIKSHPNFDGDVQYHGESCFEYKFKQKNDPERNIFLTLHLFGLSEND